MSNKSLCFIKKTTERNTCFVGLWKLEEKNKEKECVFFPASPQEASWEGEDSWVPFRPENLKHQLPETQNAIKPYWKYTVTAKG